MWEKSMYHGGDEAVPTDHVDSEGVGTLLSHQPHTQDRVAVRSEDPLHYSEQLLPPQQGHLQEATIPVWPQGDIATRDCQGSEAGGVPDG